MASLWVMLLMATVMVINHDTITKRNTADHHPTIPVHTERGRFAKRERHSDDHPDSSTQNLDVEDDRQRGAAADRPLILDAAVAEASNNATSVRNLHSSSNVDHGSLDLYDRHFAPIFHEFMKKYNRTYQRGTVEYFERFQNFLATIRRQSTVLMANFQPHSEEIPQSAIPRSAIYGLNQFSDLSVAEFRRRYLTLRVSKSERSTPLLLKSGISPKNMRRRMRRQGYPLRWDWRDSNVVTPIRDQGSCGACYATSTVAMLETMRSLKLGTLSEPLSVQQILDCNDNTLGCNGGDPHVVLRWLNGTRRCGRWWNGGKCKWVDKQALAYERDYPTYFIDQNCRHKRASKGVAQIKDFYCHFWVDEMEILEKVYKQGPVTVGVDARTWQDYLGGIIQHNCTDNLNHAVVILGFDITGPVPYYIVKNSWGRLFGERGYLFIRAGDNVCGVNYEVCGANF